MEYVLIKHIEGSQNDGLTKATNHIMSWDVDILGFVHVHVGSHICDDCFIHKCNLNGHSVDQTEERPYMNREWRKGFNQIGILNLVSHLSIHIGAESFIFQECGKTLLSNLT